MYTVESPGGKFAGLNHVYTFDPFSETLEAPAGHAARALVPDQPADARRAHVDHGRARRARLRRQERGPRAVHARRARAAGAAGSACSAARACSATPACRRSATTTRTCSGCRAAAGSSPGRGRSTPGGSRRPATAASCAGRTSRTRREPRLGHRGAAAGRARTARTRSSSSAARTSRRPIPLEPDPDALATNSVSVFDERRPDAGWNDAGSVRRGALHHPRSHANTVLLPDGSMVEVGGGWGDKKVGGENGAPGQWAAAPFHLTTRAVEPAQPDLAPRAAAARVPHLPLDRRAAARRPRGLGRATTTAAASPAPTRRATSPRTAPRSTSRRTCSTATARRRGRSCAARPKRDRLERDSCGCA